MEDVKTLMEKSGNELYKSFFAQNKFVQNHLNDIHQTWSTRYKKPSVNSFSFVNWDGVMKKQDLILEEKNALKKVFHFEDEKLFSEKFDEAVNGNGQEWTRITTLHSSSLIALLCFYKIDNNNPLVYTIDGKKCIFTKSYFECQNDIKNAPRPSNIDVVLTGKIENTNEQVILFLESKFSEYLHGGKKDDISDNVYGTVYNKLNNNKWIKFDKDGTKWSIHSNDDGSHYCEGIKQMISHYMGIMNGIGSGHFGKSNSESCLQSKDYKKIYLGEVLYQFRMDEKKLEDYAQIYSDLANNLNKIENSKLFVIPRLFTYKELFEKYAMDKNVRAFYFPEN